MRRFCWLLFVTLTALVWTTPGFSQDPLTERFTAFRLQIGQSVPNWSGALALSSSRRAAVLASLGALSHEDAAGRGPGLQMLAEGFGPGEYGEVLGAGADPEAVWLAWLASPTHRQVLTDPGWRQWGLGSAPLGTTTVWVLRLWKP